jgi:hypothetical protein
VVLVSTGGPSTPWRHRPGAVLEAAALLGAVAAAILAGPATVASLFLSMTGVVVLAAGLTVDRHRIAAVGTALVLGSVIVAGVTGLGAPRLLPAVASLVLAQSFLEGSIETRSELAGGAVERAEVLHVGTAVAAASAVAGFTYVASAGLDVGASAVGVALLFLAVLALVGAARD